MDGTSEDKPLSKTDGLPERRSDLMIVGLGGSAGAIEALQEFFRAVPADSGMAYVVILHLSPDHDSKLAEVLQYAASIPVRQVRAKEPIAADHIYVIAPNRSLAMVDGSLMLSDIANLDQRRAPIDLFFRTLGTEHDERAVSIILSGTGSDGSMGLKRVKEYNGLVLAQSPDEAAFDEMPRNAIATGLVDQVLPVAAMPAKIIAYRKHLDSIGLASSPGKVNDRDEKALVDVFTTLRTRTGHDFSNYKRGTILRRLERRMSINELAELPDYARFLRSHPDEPKALLADLLISVTNFFRDPAAFAYLEGTIIPGLFEEKSVDDHLRVWVPACATGEEAYSIAMLLVEEAETMAFPPSIQLFATDLDESAIAKAREGWYSLPDVADLSPERLRRFFQKDRDGYRIRRELREMVLFARHNLIKDPPFSHLDLASCRNLLIYLNHSAQERAMEVLHFALHPGGTLFLGASESIESATHLFSVVDRENRVFRRLPGPATIARGGHLGLDIRPDHRTIVPVREMPSVAPGRSISLELHHRLLELYAPPSLVVDDDFEILHLSESAGRYLEFHAGDASLNLLKVVRPELRLELRAALFQASRDSTPVEAIGLVVPAGETSETIDLTVQPVPADAHGGRAAYLVVFRPKGPAPAHHTPGGEAISSVTSAGTQLEEELTRAKGQMRVAVEQYETRAEELKAANEELQAMNEELRSATEELETSKEELQSVNEELHTVNQELKVKIDELSRANDDMSNLMSSTGIGTIFVDRTRRVNLFTPRAAEIFNLIPADAGRPLADITNKLEDDGDLLGEIQSVLDGAPSVEREVRTRDGRWHLMHLLPYRTAEDHAEGIVITFMDITSRKSAEQELRQSREELERRVIERTAELQRSTGMLEGALADKARLLQQVVEAQEEERRRVARELHDELGQHLTALKVGLEAAPASGDVIPRLRAIVAEIDQSVDRLALELRSPALDDLGLEGAVGNLVDRFIAASGIEVDILASGLGERRLSPLIEITLYRVLQESLTNVWKHASANRVSVVLERRDRDVQMIIEDDGKGFDAGETAGEEAAATRFGLLGIRERVSLAGGTVAVESTPGAGTSLFVRVPIAPSAEAS